MLGLKSPIVLLTRQLAKRVTMKDVMLEYFYSHDLVHNSMEGMEGKQG
jgi:hypothetical protein